MARTFILAGGGAFLQLGSKHSPDSLESSPRSPRGHVRSSLSQVAQAERLPVGVPEEGPSELSS